MIVISLIAGFILASGVSYLAFRARMLTASGAIAAALMGTLAFGLGGWPWALLLILFFVSSSVLTSWLKRRKQEYVDDYAKGNQRDASQVAANGGVATAFLLVHLATGGASLAWIGFAGALAAATADTWATELGVLSRSRPRRITDITREVETGTSGAISIAGTLAALAGAALVAGAAGVLQPAFTRLDIAGIAAGGLVGAVVDSVLGATIQAIYYCPVDGRQTEKHPLHSCGARTTLLRGQRWMNNDCVNAICTLVGAAVACALSAALPHS